MPIQSLPLNILAHSLMFFLSVFFTINTKANELLKTPLTQLISKTSCDKQVVVLGELPSHGEALGFQAKAEIAQHLISHCNFTALYFEAPVYDFLGFQQAIPKKTATEKQLDNAIGGFWTTKELYTWRKWLFAHSISGELLLAGLDDQISASSEFAKATLPPLIAAFVPTVKQSICQQAMTRNLNWLYDEQHQFNQDEINLLQQCTHLAANKTKNSSKADLNQKKMIFNAANLYARNNNATTALSRDEAMFRNFQWQNKAAAQKRKSIIWTATVHAAKKQGILSRKPLGAWLKEELKNKMTAIGFTTFSGQSSRAGTSIQSIADAPVDSLEAVASTPEDNWKYLNSADLSQLGNISARLFGKFMTTDWSSYFDGVVVFRQEKAPIFAIE